MKKTQKMLRYTFGGEAWKKIQALVFRRLCRTRISKIVAKLNDTDGVDCELYFPKDVDPFNCEPNKVFQDSIVEAMQEEGIDRDTSIALNYALANCCKPVSQHYEGDVE